MLTTSVVTAGVDAVALDVAIVVVSICSAKKYPTHNTTKETTIRPWMSLSMRNEGRATEVIDEVRKERICNKVWVRVNEQ